jgi:hypothetical protein
MSQYCHPSLIISLSFFLSSPFSLLYCTPPDVCTRLSPVFALDWFKEFLQASADAFQVQLEGSLCSTVPHLVHTRIHNEDRDEGGARGLELGRYGVSGSGSGSKASDMVGHHLWYLTVITSYAHYNLSSIFLLSSASSSM